MVWQEAFLVQINLALGALKSSLGAGRLSPVRVCVTPTVAWLSVAVFTVGWHLLLLFMIIFYINKPVVISIQP